MEKPIPDKRTFYRLAMLGRFGNVPNMWTSFEDYQKNGPHFDQLGIRCLIPGDSRFRPFVDSDDIPRVLSDLRLFPGEFILSETLPPGCHKIQGELSYIDGQLTFYHSFVQEPMRAALEQGGQHAHGLRALALLRQYADPADAEMILDLLDEYSCGGVIETCAEITIKTVPFGIYPNRSMIVWELRQY